MGRGQDLVKFDQFWPNLVKIKQGSGLIKFGKIWSNFGQKWRSAQERCFWG